MISTRIDAATRAVLRRNLSDGLADGEGVRELADRVQGVMQNRRKAAITVAQNYVGQVLSRSRDDGAHAAGMTHKSWLHSRGAGVRRPAHVAAERQYAADPIPIAEPFLVNGARLMYPRDTAGPPAETINCQCLQIYTRAPRGRGVTAAEILREYAARGFETWTQASRELTIEH